MGRYWSDNDIDRITPPQVRDIRGRAFLRTLDRLIAEKSLQDFYIRDAETCPASILPALIAEYSLEEFIEPGLPEYVVRRIIKNAWFLHEAKGYDGGVQLGLSLLGMTALIEHWYQVEPKRAANTHNITFYVGEQLFQNDQSHKTLVARQHFVCGRITAPQTPADGFQCKQSVGCKNPNACDPAITTAAVETIRRYEHPSYFAHACTDAIRKKDKT